MQHFSPIEYVKIDIANQFGLDKKSFEQRIAWVDKQKDLRKQIKKADKPAQYLAAVYALEDAQNGILSGHLVGLDACASGITILGILAGCETTSKNTGIVGKKRMDFYSECTKAMNELLTDDCEVSRADAKVATMTAYYGSKAKPKEIFGDGTDELWAFYQAQEYIAPGACHLMKELLNSWQPYAMYHEHTLPDGFCSKVPVLQKCKTKIEIDELAHTTLTYIYEENIGAERGLAVAANMTHAVDGFIVRELVRRCNYDLLQLTRVRMLIDANQDIECLGMPHKMELRTKDHGFLSLRGAEFIEEHSILEFSLNYRRELGKLIDEVLSKPSFDVICIHDEFKCHPKYMDYLREWYVTILAELADSTVGQQIIREVRGDYDYTLVKLSNDLGDKIMQSEYFLS